MKDDILVFRLFSDHLRNQFNKKMKKKEYLKKKLVLSQQNKIRCISFKNNHVIRKKFGRFGLKENKLITMSQMFINLILL